MENTCWQQIDRLALEGRILQFQEEVKLALEGGDECCNWGLFLVVKGIYIKSNYWTINTEMRSVDFCFKGHVGMDFKIQQSAELLVLVVEFLDEYKADVTIGTINKINNPLVAKKTAKKRKVSPEVDTSSLSNEEKVRFMLRQKPKNL